MSFNTLTEIKQSLGIPDAVTTHDDMLGNLLDEVHGVILEDIGGGLSAPWSTTSYTQAFDIMSAGYAGIRLPKWPVSGITSLKTGTNGGAAGSEVASSEFYVTDEGILRLQGSIQSAGQVERSVYFPVGMQNVTVTWTAGIVEGSKAWLSLKLAEKLTVSELFNTVGTQGKGGEKIGSYSYTKASASSRGAGSDMYPMLAARIVSRYRLVFPGGDPVVP